MLAPKMDNQPKQLTVRIQGDDLLRCCTQAIVLRCCRSSNLRSDIREQLPDIVRYIDVQWHIGRDKNDTLGSVCHGKHAFLYEESARLASKVYSVRSRRTELRSPL